MDYIENIKELKLVDKIALVGTIILILLSITLLAFNVLYRL